jgi:hypothetical protein
MPGFARSGTEFSLEEPAAQPEPEVAGTLPETKPLKELLQNPESGYSSLEDDVLGEEARFRSHDSPFRSKTFRTNFCCQVLHKIARNYYRHQ